MTGRPGGVIEVEGRRVRVTTLDRVLWPDAGFTKRQMIEYYVRVAPVLLPHLARRPITLHRFPEGVEGPGWYQARCRGRPAWMSAHVVRGRTGEAIDYCLIEDVASLVWAANLGTIELHPFLAPAERPDEPTVVAFDLDPGPPADLVDCCEVALWLREVLDGLGLEAFAKTSGAVGLHVYVPLGPGHRYDATKPFARGVARLLAERNPDRVIERMTRSLRPGKVLVDWLQNDPTRSTVAPYSLRAMAWPTVSTPVTWDEVEGAVRDRSPGTVTFQPGDVLDRIERMGDLFGPVLEIDQSLPEWTRDG
ncbi:MAG: non-homologous end-joining DNA ligase [Actinomycetota bacterium]|nr:non-homologous end-joining DNA ligase [Actinomycetota bacterium]